MIKVQQGSFLPPSSSSINLQKLHIIYPKIFFKKNASHQSHHPHPYLPHHTPIIPLFTPTFHKTTIQTPPQQRHPQKTVLHTQTPTPNRRHFPIMLNPPPHQPTLRQHLQHPTRHNPLLTRHVSLVPRRPHLPSQVQGEQYDRIAAVWVDGVELLRTSTAQPDGDVIFWNVRKDVTKYGSVLKKDDVTVSVMMENIVNEEFTGVYYVNVSLDFYKVDGVKLPLSNVLDSVNAVKSPLSRKLGSVNGGEELGLYPYDKAADEIVPISESKGVEEGFWFRVKDEFDVKTKKVEFSKKTYKAVLEVYVSFHGDDEFWYMNPSDEYVESNGLDTGRAHGAFREVLVTIDGVLVGGVVPFPVIFTGGINPLFWEPVVSIGAFDLPSYDIDLTPFLGMVLDGKSHKIGIQVADGISFWLVDANLHIWLDKKDVKAEIVKSKVPDMEIERENEFVLLDGEFEIEGERESEVTSWVNSSTGNLKTVFSEKVKFKNKLKYKDQGTKTDLDQSYKRKTKLKITNEHGLLIESLEVKIKHPLTITTETKPGSEKDTSVMTTEMDQERSERYYGDKISRVLSHKEKCTGLMVVKGHNVLSGSAENHQDYNYQDEFGCYSRKVDVESGNVVGDVTGSVCNNLF
ncbi:peptide-N4-(N-acetyl-beta-glucosaminyl)asparagine amidase A protein [Artemisia annua]|uniref:Peptide-N4-(N-acetyl-beta-glucosaminyl)asparagine amidase A protein n=1 Tax=Artemisia annua TaxID=35608 RepID=A0A2U1LB07_ARTAN|nr:peptide-N4-(N-acetyl-beta-glucosaminyl)asparagine amidase A protein [Artemisia annua]